MSTSFNIVMATGSFVSFISNLLSFAYLNRTFDLKKNLYFLLASDAVFDSLISLLMAGLYGYLAMTGDSNQVTCGLLIMGYPMLTDVQVICGFSTSTIRYKKMKRLKPVCRRRDSKELKYALRLIFGYLVWYGFWVLLNAIFDLKIFHLYNICLKGENSHQSTWQSWQALVICMPMVICTASMIYMDFKSYLFVVQKDQTRAKRVDNLALRATVIGLCMLIPCIIGCPILGYFLPFANDGLKYKVTFSISLVVATLRNPIVSLFTFRVNEKNQKTSIKNTRDAAYFKVLEEAKERQERLRETRIIGQSIEVGVQVHV